MTSKQQQKLDLLLRNRLKRIESLTNFAEYFEKFSYLLKKVIILTNDRLSPLTNEQFRIYNDNPWRNKRSRHFIMVQLISSSFNRSNFLLDDISTFPTLQFEGDEFTGKVISHITFENKLNHSTGYEISQLTNEETVSDILIDFLEKIYSL